MIEDYGKKGCGKHLEEKREPSMSERPDGVACREATKKYRANDKGGSLAYEKRRDAGPGRRQETFEETDSDLSGEQ
jgi:hypothetical protein